MIGIFHLSILLAVATNVLLGLGVFVTNPKRLVNKQFLAMTVLITLWFSCQWNALFSIQEGPAVFWIKQANMVSALIPCFFNLLRLAITFPEDSWFKMLARARNWFLAYIPIAVLCQTPFFLSGLKQTEALIHVPAFGPGMAIYAVYFITALILMVVRFSQNLKKTTGIERTELQFTLLGCGAALVIGAIFGIILPGISSYSQAVQFTPLSIIALDGFIAYGIATGRIMGVENVLRTVAAYSLLTAYLVLLYLGVDFAARFLLNPFIPETVPLPELISTLVIAFSLAPMHGRMQKFATRLFMTWQAIDVQTSARKASAILQTISTLDDVMERFSQLVSQTFGTDDVRIFHHEDGSYAQIFPKTTNRAAILPAHHPVVNKCRSDPEAVATELVKRSTEKEKNIQLLRGLQDTKAAAAVGIRSKSRLDGILIVGSRLSGRIYGRLELQTLQLLASQLAVALDNAQLYTELQNSKIYNDILLDNMVSGVVAINKSGRITVFNREAQRITGMSGSQTLHHPIERLPAQFHEPLKVTLEKQYGLRDIEATIINAKGEEIPVRIGTSLFHSHEGNVMGALAVLNDVSKIRQLENQIRRTDRLASLGTLSAGMAHEIKNPLVTIKTFTDLLPDRYDDSDFRHTFSELVGHEVGRIDSIVNQLLKFARPSKPNFSTLSLDDVLEHCTRLIEQQLRGRGVQLRLNLGSASAAIKGDPDLLEQVFINFFLNAIDSMESGGLLTVESRITTGASAGGSTWQLPNRNPVVQLFIRDTGSGIAPENLGRVFDPFFTTKNNGTGMGLAVSYSILQDHDAIVDVQSDLGQGTTFLLTFPTLNKEAATL